MQANFTKEQAIQYFRSKDVNRNGFLEISEVRELYNEICLRYRTKYEEKSANEFLKKLDTNKDGRISEPEFLELFFPSHKVLLPNIKNELRTHCFQLLDKNHNGFIEKLELGNFLKDIGKRHNIHYTNAQLDAMFRYYDVDGNGKISLKEFLEMS